MFLEKGIYLKFFFIILIVLSTLIDANKENYIFSLCMYGSSKHNLRIYKIIYFMYMTQ